jgi:hypothetical protein
MTATDLKSAVSGLYYYPVKSLSGIRLEEAELTPFGIRHDRLWMLTRDSGRFITQREEHRLALLKVTADDTGFVIRAPDGRTTFLPVTMKSGARVRVSVWKDELSAATGPDDAARFFTEYLGYRCVPVFMPENAGRMVREFAPGGTPLSFADAYPGLLTAEASLGDLNERTSVKIEMRRFRPNIVASGSSPYVEDSWGRLRIGQAEIALVKPCDRCVLTTVDPDSGASGKEPLKTLAQYRRIQGKVFFGQNFVVSKAGTVRLGDEIEVVERKDPLFDAGGVAAR